MHAQGSSARSPLGLGRLAAALAGLVFAAACSDPQAAVAPADTSAAAAAGVEAMFNPQPDPPKDSYRFSLGVDSLAADPGRRVWGGVFYTGVRGIDSLFVQNLAPPVRVGATLHLSQMWLIPVDSLTRSGVPMRGVMNLANGFLVLNGRTADGRGLHVMAVPVDSAASRGGPSWGIGVDSLAAGSHVGLIRINP